MWRDFILKVLIVGVTNSGSQTIYIKNSHIARASSIVARSGNPTGSVSCSSYYHPEDSHLVRTLLAG